MNPPTPRTPHVFANALSHTGASMLQVYVPRFLIAEYGGHTMASQ